MLEKWKASARKLKNETMALYYAYKHPDTPWYAKVFAGLVVASAFSPIDIVPDFIPVLGYLDDLILIPLGISLALRMIPPEVMEECRQQVAEESREGKPVNWVTGAIIILIWITLAVLCIAWVKGMYK